VQVDSITPNLKPPGTKRLKLICDNPLSKFGFKFNLRRYTKGMLKGVGGSVAEEESPEALAAAQKKEDELEHAKHRAMDDTVWGCRLTLSNPS